MRKGRKRACRGALQRWFLDGRAEDGPGLVRSCLEVGESRGVRRARVAQCGQSGNNSRVKSRAAQDGIDHFSRAQAQDCERILAREARERGGADRTHIDVDRARKRDRRVRGDTRARRVVGRVEVIGLDAAT